MSENEIRLTWKLPPTWLRFFVIILLVLGVFFRFVNLDRKVYWHDETFTSLRISGYTEAEFIKQVFYGKVIDVAYLQNYQHPHSGKSVIDTIKGLALEEPQHPPFYYAIARFWVQIFGSSVATTRSCSALISLLAFPCLYWLCLELFESPFVGWIALALLAVSPFHVLYAQEAREYSLWTVTILLSSAALLRAMRVQTKLSWLIYAGTIALGLYTYVFSIFVIFGQGIYVFVTAKLKFNQIFIAYVLASLTGFISFSPWFWLIATNLAKVKDAMEWSTQPMSLSYLINEWIYNLSYVFMDFWYIFTYYPNSPFNWNFGKYLIPLILIFIGYSIYVICRQTEKRVSLFILILIGVTAIFLMLPDLISGGYRSTMARYLTPCYIGIQLAVAYPLATQLNPISTRWQHRFWHFVTLALVSGGVLSCAVSSQAETWWNKRTTSYDDLQVAPIINKASSPLLISESGDNAVGSGFALSYLVEPKVRFLFVFKSQIPKIPDGFSNVFLYEPSNNLKSALEQEQNSKSKLVYKGRKKDLWTLDKQ